MISVTKPRNRRQRVKNLLVPFLEEHIWPLLEPEGFCWRRSLRFWRGDSSGRQALEFAFRLSRRRTDPVLAYLCPRITVRKPGLGKQVQKLMGEETTAKKNPEVLVHQSVGLVSPDRANTRWILFGKEDLTDLGPFLGEYVKTYVLPFLNRYRSCRDIVEGWESGDERLAPPPGGWIQMVAACLEAGRKEQAAKILWSKVWGKAELREEYRFALRQLGIDPTPGQREEPETVPGTAQILDAPLP